MALSVTKICNLSLSDLGAKRINDFDTDSDTPAILCRLHYEPIRDALLRSHYWPFAAGRKVLVQDTDDPPFEYDNQFILPTDFLYLRSIFADNFTVDGKSRNRHAIEEDRLLTNDSTVEIRYTKKITDPTKFDSLFVQLFVLQLDLKLVMPLSQSVKLKQSIKEDIQLLMPSVRAVARQEAELIRKLDWNDVRRIGSSRSGAQRGSF